MIRNLKGRLPAFALETDNTSYVFAVTESGHLEHLYYGARVKLEKAEDCAVFSEKREFEAGNVIVYSEKYPSVIPEDMCLEISSGGHGDVREPFLEIVKPNGCRSSDFTYSSYRISDSREPLKTLPCAYCEDGRLEHLCVTLSDGDLLLDYPRGLQLRLSAELCFGACRGKPESPDTARHLARNALQRGGIRGLGI